jgi:hypothetical protein
VFSLSFIVLIQVFTVSLCDFRFPWVVLLHLRIQIRYIISDISILRSLVAPVLCSGSLFCLGFGVLMVRVPQPRVVSIFRGGQILSLWCHRCHTLSQTSFFARCGHSMSIWFINSSSLHVWHCIHLGFPVLDQKLPVLCTLCIALNKNCPILGLMSLDLVLFHIVSFLSSCPISF